MGIKNYLKCINGIPQQPFEWTLDPAHIPEVVGVTWEEFDLDIMNPRTISAALVGGRVVEDPVRKAVHEDTKTKKVNRRNAHKAAKESAVTRANWGAMTVAERKIAVGLAPTDVELGI